MIRILIFIVALLITPSVRLFGQIDWTTYDKELSPSVFTVKGNFLATNPSGTQVGINGIFEINYDAKTIYFSDYKTTIKINSDSYSNIFLSFDKKLISVKESDNIFSKSYQKKILKAFRKNVFDSLGLNTIQISSCDKCEISTSNDQNILISPQIKKEVKLVSIGPYHATVIDAEGSLFNLNEDKFNLIEFNGKSFYFLSSLYDHFFNNYRFRQIENISSWESNLKKLSIDSIVSILGPITDTKIMPDGRTLISWERKRYKHKVNVASRSISIGDANTSYYSNPFTSIRQRFNIGNIFFNYYYSSLETRNYQSQIQMGSSRYNGTIGTEENSERIMIIFDKNNKPNIIQHENYFKDPTSGQSFDFLIQ